MRQADGGAEAAAAGLDDGLRLVTAGVESMLQRMTVTLNRISIRLDGASEGGAPASMSLSCQQLVYGAAPAAQDAHTQVCHTDCPPLRLLSFTWQPHGRIFYFVMHGGGVAFWLQDCATLSTARHVHLSSVCLTAGQGDATLVAPFNADVHISASWPLDAHAAHEAHVRVMLSLEALQLQLRPSDIAMLWQLMRQYTSQAKLAGHSQPEPAQPCYSPTFAAASAATGSVSAPPAAGHASASFLEDMMLPGCEATLHAAVLESMADVSGQVLSRFSGAQPSEARPSARLFLHLSA
jgi:hypothetical protein